MRRAQWTAVAMLVALAGCASTREKREAALYSPTESVIEVIAVLRRHVPDDTYRLPPATDFGGRNVYRASLLRLENLESGGPHELVGSARSGLKSSCESPTLPTPTTSARFYSGISCAPYARAETRCTS